jgi:hypothetical protein
MADVGKVDGVPVSDKEFIIGGTVATYQVKALRALMAHIVKESRGTILSDTVYQINERIEKELNSAELMVRREIDRQESALR